MSYKWCAVPKCTNTSIKTPEKLFVSVPKNVEVRRKWLKLSCRDPNDIANSTNIFFCEDHFDMASFTPVTLLGDNLGQRHRYLNFLVREAKDNGDSFHDIEALPEQSPVDRLFKIDLATKQKNVKYIIRNLKDVDMLYVSRALKSTWLLDHRDIINPKYLEDDLFPEMITPAVSKMKHWLYINLRDQATCQEFYLYYKEGTFQFAIKFLSHCSQEFIQDEAPKILTKLSPHYLKVLSEKCPKVAKIYFDSLAMDEDVRTQYLKKEKCYYNSVKCVLKSDADVFLDITEMYFNVNSFSRFSPSATDYIIRNHKSRFTSKLELYVAYLLHIPTLAEQLSVDECQEVVLKLARANYLQQWFQYKVVEPLIMRISPDMRAGFKKRVFVAKDFGERVGEWPYRIPIPPIQPESGHNVFDDQEFSVFYEYDNFRVMLKRKKCSKYSSLGQCFLKADNMKSDLDRLFDEFRFIGFERALYELSKRMGATGSADRRRDIFLVLVSKSGGRSDAVAALLRLASRHSNEPAHSRAAVLRSLVKRGNVWRLPADIWQYVLDFGHGLGLDGSTPEAVCREGLHAVVIRQLLAGQCEPAISTAFLNDFSTLAEYTLNGDERARVAIRLQNMLEVSAMDAEPAVAVQRLSQLLDVLKIYRIRVKPGSVSVSPAIKAVMALALRDPDVARPILEQFYNARIARRELFAINLKFRRDEPTLVNALRHDPAALELKRIVDILTGSKSRFDDFISKLIVYFQTDNLTTQLRSALKEIAQGQNVKLARPLTSLLGNDLINELHELEAAGPERLKLAAGLRACAHRARPLFNLADWGWRKAGVKAVATRAIRCPEIERAEITRALAAERRTVRVALALSMRCEGSLVIETLRTTAELRPAAALRAAMLYFHRHDEIADLKVWDIIKPLLSGIDLSKRDRLCRLLQNTTWIPSDIRADYCASLYFIVNKFSYSNLDLVLLDLSKLLPLCDKSVENILLHILEHTNKDEVAIRYPAIFVRYLMLSRNDEDLEERFFKIGDRFLESLDTLRCEKDFYFQERLNQILNSLKYNAAFLDTKYTSCLSVIAKILAWIEKFMPKEKYFKEYVQIHLTMLFYKAVRQIMKQMPEVLADPKRRKSEGADAVGFVFGRYIAKEVADLVRTYFDSIVELYSDVLAEYLADYFMYGSSRSKLIKSMLKGMLAEGVGNQRRLAVYVLRKRRYIVEDSVRTEIERLMTQDESIAFFVHGELFT